MNHSQTNGKSENLKSRCFKTVYCCFSFSIPAIAKLLAILRGMLHSFDILIAIRVDDDDNIAPCEQEGSGADSAAFTNRRILERVSASFRPAAPRAAFSHNATAEALVGWFIALAIQHASELRGLLPTIIAKGGTRTLLPPTVTCPTRCPKLLEPSSQFRVLGVIRGSCSSSMACFNVTFTSGCIKTPPVTASK